MYYHIGVSCPDCSPDQVSDLEKSADWYLTKARGYLCEYANLLDEAALISHDVRSDQNLSRHIWDKPIDIFKQTDFCSYNLKWEEEQERMFLIKNYLIEYQSLIKNVVYPYHILDESIKFPTFIMNKKHEVDCLNYKNNYKIKVIDRIIELINNHLT